VEVSPRPRRKRGRSAFEEARSACRHDFRAVRFYTFPGGCGELSRYSFQTGAASTLVFEADEALSFLPRAPFVKKVETDVGQPLCGAEPLLPAVNEATTARSSTIGGHFWYALRVHRSRPSCGLFVVVGIRPSDAARIQSRSNHDDLDTLPPRESSILRNCARSPLHRERSIKRSLSAGGATPTIPAVTREY
jgi:hypothetical protein